MQSFNGFGYFVSTTGAKVMLGSGGAETTWRLQGHGHGWTATTWASTWGVVQKMGVGQRPALLLIVGAQASEEFLSSEPLQPKASSVDGALLVVDYRSMGLIDDLEHCHSLLTMNSWGWQTYGRSGIQAFSPNAGAVCGRSNTSDRGLDSWETRGLKGCTAPTNLEPSVANRNPGGTGARGALYGGVCWRQKCGKAATGCAGALARSADLPTRCGSGSGPFLSWLPPKSRAP